MLRFSQNNFMGGLFSVTCHLGNFISNSSITVLMLFCSFSYPSLEKFISSDYCISHLNIYPMILFLEHSTLFFWCHSNDANHDIDNVRYMCHLFTINTFFPVFFQLLIKQKTKISILFVSFV